MCRCVFEKNFRHCSDECQSLDCLCVQSLQDYGIVWGDLNIEGLNSISQGKLYRSS